MSHIDNLPDFTQTKFNFTPEANLLAGRTVIVTGANVGLGLWAAIHLGRLSPSKLILAVRTPSKGETARQEIAAKSGLDASRVEVWELDLSSFDSVNRFAEKARKLERLDVLCENAGIASFGFKKTDDGWEEIFQVNDLATGLLGVQLLPLLAKTAKLSLTDGQKAFKPHLAIVGSGIHSAFKYTKPKDASRPLLEEFNDESSPNKEERYAFSKLVSNHLATGIAHLPLAKDVIVTSINPGLCLSDLVRNAPPEFQTALKAKSMPTEEGAKNIAYGSVADIKDKGAYISEMEVADAKRSEFSQSAEGKDLEKKLWAEMAQLWIKLDPSVKETLA
ncbi:hypothetical protein HKX48_005134 [Thoreauomyces humboldtii]|nr:hypothetical protein HKX48_005134 [Thoreauomyces humboldtii]